MLQGINCPICQGTHYRLCPALTSVAIQRRAIHNMTDLERAEWERAAAFEKGDHGMQRICEAAIAAFVDPLGEITRLTAWKTEMVAVLADQDEVLRPLIDGEPEATLGRTVYRVAADVIARLKRERDEAERNDTAQAIEKE